MAKRRGSEGVGGISFQYVCARCQSPYNNEVVQEEELNGVCEQFVACPVCKFKNSILFYDKYLDEMIEEFNSDLKKLKDDDIKIVNHKKRIGNIVKFLESEAKKRSIVNNYKIKFPEELDYLR